MNCITRLRRFAADLAADAPEAVGPIIVGTRWLARKKTYKDAGPSRMMADAKSSTL